MSVIKGHKIAEKIETDVFLDLLKDIKEQDILTTDHTFFRLDEPQRKVFKAGALKRYILHEVPILVGRQYNGCYAVFYAYEKENIRITLDIQPRKVNIVTFYIVDNKQIPRI